MPALEFLFDFFTDINVYIAGALVYLFPKFFRAAARKGWGWGKSKL